MRRTTRLKRAASRPSAAWRASFGSLLVLGLVAGCGARTPLELDEPPEGPPDAAQPAAPDAGPPDAGLPAVPCASDAQCDHGVCRARPGFRPVDDEPLPLVCGAADADGAAVGASCIDRSDCDRGICTISGACVKPCATDVDCAIGERCVEVWVRTSDRSMQPLEACAPLVTAPADVRVVGPEAGPAFPGGLGATVDDPLPDLHRSTLVVWLTEPGSTPLLAQVRGRDSGEVHFEGFGGGRATPRWGVNGATVTDALTLLYPNGPNTPPADGGFDAFLRSFEASSSERIVLQRDREGAVFDVDAYLVGVPPTSDGALPPALVQGFEDANALLAQVGLTIGEVRVHDLVGRLERDLEILEGASGPLGVPTELPALYRLSAGARRPSVHIFFVRLIDGAAGIASGIPGPHAIAGTGASGVAIGVDLLPPGWLGNVIVHEVGHFMGLFHTSELDGTINDPLPDTAECRIDRDADGDGFVTAAECEGAGADNVMFWSGEENALTPQQGEIMRRALFVR